ncbi:MAG: hypothetical protein NZM35_07010 [Chitinophagales bacterium]|nr:hypothetical protein [Chitinophagales bacterium]MDW8420166.1 hypothetical protein [Chitinophagales bacterium]
MKLRNRVQKLLLVFTIIACALLAEIALRISGVYETVSERNGKDFFNPYLPLHTGVHYRHKVNSVVHVAQPEFEYEHCYDARGYRNENNTDTGAIRILAFGDSFTEGLGAPADSTWPSLLEDISGCPVYNAGVMGSDPGYYYAAYLDIFRYWRPDIALYMLNFSDIYEVHTRGGLSRFGDDGKVHYKPTPCMLGLYKTSHLYRAIIHGVLRYDFMLNPPGERDKNVRASLDTIAQICELMNRACRSRGAAFIVFIHPVPQEYFKRLDTRTDFSRVDELCDMLAVKNVQCVSLRRAMENILQTADNWKNISWEIDGHFNSKGNRVIAQILSQHIKACKPDNNSR